MTGIEQFIANYEKAVAHLNCDYADEHGVCELLSDDEMSEYCMLGMCPNYEEKVK